MGGKVMRVGCGAPGEHNHHVKTGDHHCMKVMIFDAVLHRILHFREQTQRNCRWCGFLVRGLERRQDRRIFVSKQRVENIFFLLDGGTSDHREECCKSQRFLPQLLCVLELTAGQRWAQGTKLEGHVMQHRERRHIV